ncbi:DUF4301 family protein [Bacteroides caecigallinarum]|uniref:DUF4301 family protein n=1 Tax=Bacteroides caecigallinarum TaxID=1411144 RepID=UPI0019598EDD|nr:DUF4301 family protein [Bacteroides caecigallinarum]MBM6889824.1 DUF4301 family protein [Bacteroides caecigallinarum]MCF2552693.1 DUF4301 family protein [Bacteroides caecigallinarum]
MLTQEDKDLLAKKGISEQQIAEQLACFEKGFPYLKLFAAASVENRGIMLIGEDAKKTYLAAWDSYKESDKKVVKFVPASGAASRMFKNMFEFLGADYDVPTTDFEKKFFNNIKNFAFYADLDAACVKNNGKGIDALVAEGNYKAVVANLLESAGLNYGSLPKGLLKFHKYENGARTPLEEHLVEGALYAAGKSGEVNVHFTVSTEHRELFAKLVDEKVAQYAAKYGIKYNISFSEQKPSTDTVAADMENKPFRDNGKLLFRPGGHGALIENLNDLDADIVFIKNIDNVVPDRLKADTVTYKKLLAGVLVTLQKQAFEYLQLLDSGHYRHDELENIIRFVQQQLHCRKDDIKDLEDADLVIYLRKKLNRPMRVCGMVKNVGEPGGGPFLAYNPDGSVSLQILESSQIDMNDPEKKAMFEKGTHFNPVDLVCAIRDYKGNKFNLVNYVDKATGFISYKSKGGKELKALELPGLWNGSMSDWSTVFVEVPLSTFNPVKTVNDLLRDQHQ